MTVGENGIINQAMKSAFVSKMREYQEMSDEYVAERIANRLEGTEENVKICVGLEDQPGIETILTDIDDQYKNKIIIQNDIFYYKYDGNKQSKQQVQWCFEAGIPVWGYGDYQSFQEDTEDEPITTGEYTAIDGVYVCAPDLTGFNKRTTYYVLYDENGNEVLGNTLRLGAPEDISEWYNYASSVQKWANIVTLKDVQGGTMKAYFTWIPRYVYKVDKVNKTVDIKFVDLNNYYIDFQTGEKTQYSDTEPVYDENGVQTNYCLPEAFKWGEQDIPGIWVSKYEVSAGIDYNIKISDFTVTSKNTSLTITKVTTNESAINSIKVDSYDVYLDDEFMGNTKTFPYTIDRELVPNTEYKIKIVARDSNDEKTVFDTYTKTVKTTEAKINELLLENQSTQITLKNMNTTVDSDSLDVYEIYLDDVLLISTKAIPFPYVLGSGLIPDTVYTIKIIAKSTSGQVLTTYVETEKTLKDSATIQAITKPNLMGYIKSNTYYVVYDSSGNESIGDLVQYDANGVPTNIPGATESSPNGTWYNYENNLWANIVTIGGDGDKTNDDNPRAYFTWIPRYEFKVMKLFKEIEIRFIPASQDEASTEDYLLPEAFKWGQTDISGIWVSKYEVSDMPTQ